MASAYSTSCVKCTQIFTASTEEAAVRMRDAHEQRCPSDRIPDYDPRGASDSN